MLGVRGVRLGIIKDGLYKMQVRALLEAAQARTAKGGNPIIEIMIPLIVSFAELDLVRQWVEEEIDAVLGADGRDGSILIGTMIETPRAAIAGRRDRRGRRLLQLRHQRPHADDLRVLPRRRRADPREVPRGRSAARSTRSSRSTSAGVGELVRMGVEGGRRHQAGPQARRVRRARRRSRLDRLLLPLGLDYVSCSPFRVPIARLAAARSVLDVGGDATA